MMKDPISTTFAAAVTDSPKVTTLSFSSLAGYFLGNAEPPPSVTVELLTQA